MRLSSNSDLDQRTDIGNGPRQAILSSFFLFLFLKGFLQTIRIFKNKALSFCFGNVCIVLFFIYLFCCC